jgi:hypothetical protein
VDLNFQTVDNLQFWIKRQEKFLEHELKEKDSESVIQRHQFAHFK